MSIRVGDRIVAAGGMPINKSALYLFDFKWSDHLIEQVEWLRSDTFSWQDGTVYSDAYQHLYNDRIDPDTTSETETVGGVTISFYRSPDGHKIVSASEESKVAQIYENTGIAWYYILDTTNKRFKLPRTKYGFTGLRDTVGKFVPESLPNIKGELNDTDIKSTQIRTGCFYSIGNDGSQEGGGASSSRPHTGFDASRCSSTYQDNAPVQQNATQMYLYFFVGNYSQSALEQTAGITTEILNDKVDKASLEECHVVVESYQNGTNWYRLYDDGWIEQGGYNASGTYSSPGTTTLLITMLDTNYCITIGAKGEANNTTSVAWRDKTTTNFKTEGGVNGSNPQSRNFTWEVKGYAAQ